MLRKLIQILFITNLSMSYIPKQCFSCGNAIKDEYYNKYETVYKKSTKIIMRMLDDMGLEKPCCRRMILGYDPEYIKIIKMYDETSVNSSTIIEDIS